MATYGPPQLEEAIHLRCVAISIQSRDKHEPKSTQSQCANQVQSSTKSPICTITVFRRQVIQRGFVPSGQRQRPSFSIQEGWPKFTQSHSARFNLDIGGPLMDQDSRELFQQSPRPDLHYHRASPSGRHPLYQVQRRS